MLRAATPKAKVCVCVCACARVCVRVCLALTCRLLDAFDLSTDLPVCMTKLDVDMTMPLLLQIVVGCRLYLLSVIKLRK